MMSAFVRLFGDYPFAAPYQSVVTEDDLEIPLEAQGLSIFGANFLEDDWSTERLVAHELSHQWFGNSLTIRSWRDIWMHEGFACYSEWLWSEESGQGSADEQGPRALEAPRRPAAGPAARRPGARRHVRRPRLQARSAAAARPAADDGRRHVLRVPARVGGGPPARLCRAGTSSPRRSWRSGAVTVPTC